MRRVVRASLGEQPVEPDQLRKWFVLLAYSVRPKRTSLDRLDRASRRLEAVLDLPSAFGSLSGGPARREPDWLTKRQPIGADLPSWRVIP